VIAATDVVAVVLAAGLSRRYAQGDKLIRTIAGKPLALHIADTLRTLPFARLISVCSRPVGPVASGFAERGFEIIVNPDPARGQGTSLALAADAVRASAPAMLVCLSDMPFVTEAHLRALLDRFDPAAGIDAVASANGPTRGPPALFGAVHLPALAALSGDRGARPLLQAAALVAASAGELKDFDTAEDFERP
jgi:molybdenum cofactor cytidylyltransferase